MIYPKQVKIVKMARLWCISLLLVGCGSLDSPPSPGLNNSGTQTIALTGAPLEIQHQGVLLRFGPTAFGQPTQVTLGPPEQPPSQPANPRFRANGSYFEMDLGGSKLNGDITITFPQAPENAEVEVLVDNCFLPLRDQVHHPDGSLSGTLNFYSGSHFRVGLVESDSRPVPHQSWGSWNGYVFRPAANGSSLPGSFQKVVEQGQVISPGLPNLGDRPLIIVHGLGSSINGKTFDALAQHLLEQGTATSILGFEYDSLDHIQSNGTFLRQALQLFSQSSPSAPQWNFVAHSMGTLVTRSAIEQPGPAVLPGPTGRAVFLCGPHLGSGVIDNLQGRRLMGDLLSILARQNYMDFRNRDGQPCLVENREPGLDDLRTDSAFLAALNENAASHHPSTSYYTLAGGLRRKLLELCATIFTLSFDDGVVNIPSANFSGLGQRRSDVLLADHLSVNLVRSTAQPEGDSDISFPRVLQFLTEP